MLIWYEIHFMLVLSKELLMSGEVQWISGEQGEVRAKFFYQIKTSELKQTRGRLDYWVDSEAASNSYISTIRRQAISVSQVEYNNHWER